MKPKDISTETYREYDVPGRSEPYRIFGPKELYVGTTCHRVVDVDGITHCIPTAGAVIRWKANPPVSF